MGHWLGSLWFRGLEWNRLCLASSEQKLACKTEKKRTHSETNEEKKREKAKVLEWQNWRIKYWMCDCSETKYGEQWRWRQQQQQRRRRILHRNRIHWCVSINHLCYSLIRDMGWNASPAEHYIVNHRGPISAYSFFIRSLSLSLCVTFISVVFLF